MGRTVNVVVVTALTLTALALHAEAVSTDAGVAATLTPDNRTGNATSSDEGAGPADDGCDETAPTNESVRTDDGPDDAGPPPGDTGDPATVPEEEAEAPRTDGVRATTPPPTPASDGADGAALPPLHLELLLLGVGILTLATIAQEGRRP